MKSMVIDTIALRASDKAVAQGRNTGRKKITAQAGTRGHG